MAILTATSNFRNYFHYRNLTPYPPYPTFSPKLQFPLKPQKPFLHSHFHKTCFYQLQYFSKFQLSAVPPIVLHQNAVVSDLLASGLTFVFVLSCLQFWKETAKRRVFDQKLNRKLVHISFGLVFMLCWPLFSSGSRGALLAALIPGVNMVGVLLVGYGIWKDEGTVKSISRYGDRRELLKGPLYYALSITLACAIYWRTSPIAIAAICNLCAGDGMADVVGRQFGSQKIPYNKNKSIAGSMAMAVAGFLTSVGYMYYFASFGYIQGSWEMVLGFLIVSIGSALVESHPLSTVLEDNLTVTIASVALGNLVF